MLKVMNPAPPVILFVLLAGVAAAQVSPKSAAPSPRSVAEHAVSLAEAGRCAEALPALKKSASLGADKQLQKQVALNGLRCANVLQRPGEALDFVRILNEYFASDPEVLYVLIHAYSDLSSAAARDLARTAPSSIQALELDAESNELQGKWDEAEKDYRRILERDPNYPGIHFRLARIQLSRPNPPSDFQDIAKKELLQELAINPNNAGAEYILGELARQSGDLDEAIQRFTKATKLDQDFADAYLALGASLLTQKRYADAIPPLQMVVKLQPTNPLGHYDLATAYARSGRKEEAEREFAAHKQMSGQNTATGAQAPQ
jgi:tetratricopeptide (TPR) repeat protein